MLRMLGSRALVARLAPRHQATRHKGILSSFKESIDKEMKKNPELQKTLDELREGAAPLAKGAQEAASKLSSAAAEGGAGRMYTIDVVPAALGFWAKLGFEEVAATGEQAELIPRGGDRPMAKLL